MKKISTPEAIFLILGCIVVDLIDLAITIFLLDLGGAGEFIKWTLNIFFWAIISIYFIIKGVRQLWFMAGSLIEFIPVINALPIRTITMIIVIVLDRSPRAQHAIAMATPKVSHLKK